MNAPANVVGSLNRALHDLMRDDPAVVVLGEDLLDPYGGAFKVTRGLSDAWPERVFSTPISEAGFTGIAGGMALRGLRPVVEIMFGDFLLLAADQLVNHIAKYRWMYDDQVRVPLTIRTPMGGGRGYGPTHSQTLEKHFLGVPGLRIVAPSPFHDPGALLREAVLGDDDPVLFIENKLMYARPVRRAPHDGRLGELHARATARAFPTVRLAYDRFEHMALTIVAYGGMAEPVLAAARTLLVEDELAAEVVVPSSIAPLDLEPILASLRRTGRLIVVDEAPPGGGWAAELLARVASEGFELLAAAPLRLTALDLPIANTRTLEEEILPQPRHVIEAARSLCAPPRSR